MDENYDMDIDAELDYEDQMQQEYEAEFMQNQPPPKRQKFSHDKRVVVDDLV